MAFLSRLNPNRFRPQVCSFSPGGFFGDELIARGIPVHVLYKREGIDYTLTLRLARLMAKERIDVIHSHNLTPWMYSAPAGKMTGVKKIVHTEHSNVFLHERQQGFNVAERALALITDNLLTDSHRVAQYLIENRGISSEGIRVVLNGIDMNLLQRRYNPPALRAELKIPRGHQVVGNIAEMVSYKDHRNLFYAFAMLTEELRSTVLVLVGDGQERSNLEALARKLEIYDKVRFVGHRDDIPQFLKMFDIFVLPSFDEGFAFTLIEAMATGKPVVATAVGDTPEVVQSGKNGFLVRPRDPEDIKEKMALLLKDRQLRHQMGQAGMRIVAHKFSIKGMVNRYQKIYSE